MSSRTLHRFSDWFHVYLLETTRFLRSATDRLPSNQWHYTQASQKSRCACGKAVEAGKTQCSRCRVVERGRLHPPCKCGGNYFALGKCRPCYFREYNKTRVRAVLLMLVLVVLACKGDSKPVPPADPCLSVARVVVVLNSSNLVVGDTTQAHAIAYDSSNKEITGCPVTWSAK